MIRNPIDIATRVSPELSAFIENRINNSETDQYITLGTIQKLVTGLLSHAFVETEQLHHFDVTDSLLDELNALIEEFGESALAIDFVRILASEQLSRIIETVANDRDEESPPTLEMVRDAIVTGLPASLVGAGVLEEDEASVLLAEIEALINRHGSDALAEEFLRYE